MHREGVGKQLFIKDKSKGICRAVASSNHRTQRGLFQIELTLSCGPLDYECGAHCLMGSTVSTILFVF